MASSGAERGRRQRPFVVREHETDAPTIGKVAEPVAPALPGFDLDRQPAVRAEAGQLGALWVQACSIAGRSHAEAPNPSSGQDSYSYRLSDDGAVAVLAVADGLGSRPRSHVGAQTAAVEACARFCDSSLRHVLDGDVGRVATDRAVLTALAQVERRLVDVGERGSGGQDVATTLLVAMVGLGGKQPSATFIRVGDPSAILMKDGQFTDRSLVFGSPEAGPANALSACLPMRAPEREIEVVRVGPLPDGITIVLVTDGVGNDLAGSGELRQWFAERWAEPTDSAGMIDTLRYRRQGSIDDRTAVVVFTAPGRGELQRTDPGLPVPPPPELPTRGETLPGQRPQTSRRTAVAIGAGALALGAIALAAWAATSDNDGTSFGLVQSAGPGQGEGSIVVPRAEGVEARVVPLDTFDGSITDGRILTSVDGRLVVVDGCGLVHEVSAETEDVPDVECEDPTTPSLAVPVTRALLVVQGDQVGLVGDEPIPLGDAAQQPLVGDAVDATLASGVIVFAGPAGIGVLGADAREPVLVPRTYILEAPDASCSDPRYVAIEASDAGQVVVAAECDGGGWAVAGIDPELAASSCPAIIGDGVPPLPIRVGDGSVVLAFPARSSSGAAVTAAFEPAACTAHEDG